MFRKFRFFQQQSFHIGEDQAGIERAGTVDVPDAAFAIDEKDAQGVVERTLWIGGVGPFVHGLVVGGEDGFQLRARFRRGEAPFAARFFFADGFGISGETLRRVVLRDRSSC